MNNNNDSQILDVLTREGVLVSVSVRYWRATKKLQADDLGLKAEQLSDELISLGHKKLLPKEALHSLALIEGRAHALIEASTFPFLGMAHFLPNGKLAEVNAALNKLEAEFGNAKTSFLENYETLREQARQGWREAAEKLVKEPDRLVARIEDAFPDPDRLESKFRFSAQYFQIRLPESLKMQCLEASEQEAVIRAREVAAQTAAARIHTEAEQFVSECVTTLRRESAELCEAMLESMRSGKTGVHQKTLNRLVRFIEEFRKLNFVGDREMETQLNRIREEFLGRSAESYRDDESARQSLQTGLRSLASTARELANQDAGELVARFGKLGNRRIERAA